MALQVPRGDSIHEAGTQSGWHLADLLGGIPGEAGRLEALQRNCFDSDLLAGVVLWLQGEAGLTSLIVEAHSLPPSTPAALRQLCRLQLLHVSTNQLPAGILARGVLHLQQLSELLLSAGRIPAVHLASTCRSRMACAA